MTKPPRFRANITTRYGAAEKATYEEVMRRMREAGVSRSRMQLILVRRGLKSFESTSYGWTLRRRRKEARNAGYKISQ